MANVLMSYVVCEIFINMAIRQKWQKPHINEKK